MRISLYSIMLCIVVCIPSYSHAQVVPDASGNFITIWDTENPGTSANNQITIPGTDSGYNYDIYWQSLASSTITGATTSITSNSHTITFPSPGQYEVQISGLFPRVYFNNSGDKDKLLSVEQWGDIAWSSMRSAFHGASNLSIPATDAPDLSGVTDLSNMFAFAGSFNDPIKCHPNDANVSGHSF
jgi:hypothetical protein